MQLAKMSKADAQRIQSVADKAPTSANQGLKARAMSAGDRNEGK